MDFRIYPNYQTSFKISAENISSLPVFMLSGGKEKSPAEQK